jgi:hypothetical protein
MAGADGDGVSAAGTAGDGGRLGTAVEREGAGSAIGLELQAEASNTMTSKTSSRFFMVTSIQRW